jgi:hypothetical protein
VTKLFPFELTSRKEVRKLVDLIIPMGSKDQSKEVVGMVKGREKKHS